MTRRGAGSRVRRHDARAAAPSRALSAGALALVAVLLAGCTSENAADVTASGSARSTSDLPGGTSSVQVTEAPEPTTESSTAPGSIVVVDPSTADTASPGTPSVDTSSAGTADPSASGASSSSGGSSAPGSSTASSSAEPEAKPATISVSPKDKTTNVAPLGRIQVKSSGGVLTNVTVTNPEGRIVYHSGPISKGGWAVDPELGYGRLYTVTARTLSTDGVITDHRTTFRTAPASARVTVSITPSDQSRVGTGQPLEFTFSQAIPQSYRRAVEKMITVDAHPTKVGAFRWYSSTVVRWRPALPWRSGSVVKVYADIYGKKLGPGAYGAQDVTRLIRVVRRMESFVDASTHQMKVYQDGKLLRTIPVSLGNSKYPTPNGTYVVTQKLATHVMDSSTWGLKGVGAYRTRVKWATRISSGGVFVHGAPWSEYAQGNTNVSHGCINMTDAAAQWFQRISMPGDMVTVVKSSGPRLESWDGYGDWNIPFSKY